MKLPFDPAQLPAELRDAILEGLHDAAADAEPPLLGHLLGAEAYCLFEEGLEFMVEPGPSWRP